MNLFDRCSYFLSRTRPSNRRSLCPRENCDVFGTLFASQNVDFGVAEPTQRHGLEAVEILLESRARTRYELVGSQRAPDFDRLEALESRCVQGSSTIYGGGNPDSNPYELVFSVLYMYILSTAPTAPRTPSTAFPPQGVERERRSALLNIALLSRCTPRKH